MKNALIIHNPTAGASQHNKEEVIAMVSELGYRVRYISTNGDDWKTFVDHPMDAIFLAGGDGTVHKVAKVLLEDQELQRHRVPIHLIPVGTANNIAKALRHTPEVKVWSLPSPAADNRFDCGQVAGLEEKNFFLESAGFGVFPQLIHKMRKEDTAGMEPSQKLALTLEVLLRLVQEFKPQKARIKTDGITMEGKFLMVELMNIRYVGPNLDLAPQAKSGDGFFDLAIIPKKSRKQFLAYLEKRIADPADIGDMGLFVKTLRVKEMSFSCPEAKFHIDDILLSGVEGKKMVLTLLPGAFELIA